MRTLKIYRKFYARKELKSNVIKMQKHFYLACIIQTRMHHINNVVNRSTNEWMNEWMNGKKKKKKKRKNSNQHTKQINYWRNINKLTRVKVTKLNGSDTIHKCHVKCVKQRRIAENGTKCHKICQWKWKWSITVWMWRYKMYIVCIWMR